MHYSEDIRVKSNLIKLIAFSKAKFLLRIFYKVYMLILGYDKGEFIIKRKKLIMKDPYNYYTISYWQLTSILPSSWRIDVSNV